MLSRFLPPRARSGQHAPARSPQGRWIENDESSLRRRDAPRKSENTNKSEERARKIQMPVIGNARSRRWRRTRVSSASGKFRRAETEGGNYR
jgi:hypothetical protein